MKLFRLYPDPSSWTQRRARSLVLLSEVLLAFALLALILNGHALPPSRAAVSEPPSSKTELPALSGEEAISHLQQQGLYSSLQEAMQAARYGPQWVTNTGIAGMDGAYEMKNPANHLRAYVSASELRVLPMIDEAQRSWQLGLKLASCGHGDNLSAAGAGEVKVAGNRVEIRRSAIGNPQSAIVEWYENSASGIEHGFTIDARPESAIRNPQSTRSPCAWSLSCPAVSLHKLTREGSKPALVMGGRCWCTRNWRRGTRKGKSSTRTWN